jgi:cytochrome P450
MTEHAARCPIVFDPAAPEQRQDPVPVYRRLREDCPVHYADNYDLWVVSRYDDVNSVIRATDTFSSIGAVTSSVAPLPQAVLDILAEGWWPVTMMTQTDDPLHRRLRNLVQKAFTPKRVAALEPLIRDYAEGLVDGFKDDGEVDIIHEFAWPLPISVVGRLLGVPEADVPSLHHWSRDMLMLLQANGTQEDLEGHARGLVEMQRYFTAALEERRSEPRDDLMSSLFEAWDEDEVSFPEMVQIPFTLIVAGHVTVTRAIGSGLWVLLRRPEMIDKLRDSPERMARYVEEALRLEAPAQGLFRNVKADFEIDGVTIPAGSRVMVQFGAANHDESVFANPDEIDLDRTNMSQHLAFGKGAHFCIGAPLARLELPIAFSTLLDQLPNLRLVEGAHYTRDPVFFARGFEQLAVEWDPAAR